MKQLTMQLETLTCPSCMQKIENGLKKQAGIKKLEVLFNSSKVKAEIDENEISAEEVQRVVERLGYEVEKVKTKEI